MSKYSKLRRLATVSDKDMLPFGKQTDVLRDEARALLAERDEAVALWREWIKGINYPEGEEDFNDRIKAFLARAGGGDE